MWNQRSTGVIPVVVTVTGAWKDLDLGNWKSGDKSTLKASVSLRYYKLSIGGTDLVEVDVENMVRIIDGTDQLAPMRDAIGV